MNVLIVTARRDPFISPQDMDGGCTLVRNYIKQLYNAGHNICVFTRAEACLKSGYNDHSQRKITLQKEAGLGAVRVNKRAVVYRIPYSAGEGKTAEEVDLAEARSFTRSLKPYLDTIPFDIVHYFHLMSIAGWYEDFSSIPYLNKTVFSPLLLSVGRTYECGLNRRLELERRVFEDCKYIVSQSDSEIEQIVRNYNISTEKITKIPLGVDNEIFYYQDRVRNRGKDLKLVIVCPNAIRPQKRQHEVVKIINYLKMKSVKTVCVMVGNINDEDYYNDVLALIQSTGLSYRRIFQIPTRQDLMGEVCDLILMHGQKQTDLAKILRISDVGLFPSHDEGFGLVLLDTLACGAVPVCYKLKAYEEFLEDRKNSLCVEISEGWEGLAQRILELAQNPELLADLATSGTKISHNLSWSVVLLKQLNLYSQIIDANDQTELDKRHEINWGNLWQ